jgi:hypothetical protein
VKPCCGVHRDITRFVARGLVQIEDVEDHELIWAAGLEAERGFTTWTGQAVEGWWCESWIADIVKATQVPWSRRLYALKYARRSDDARDAVASLLRIARSAQDLERAVDAILSWEAPPPGEDP